MSQFKGGFYFPPFVCVCVSIIMASASSVASASASASSSASASKAATVDCPICDEPVATLYACNSCKKQCCHECLQTYLLNCGLDPICMYPECKVPILHEVLLRVLNRKWFMTIYRKHRVSLLSKVEAGRMQETQAASTAYIAAMTIVSQAGFVLPRMLESARACVAQYGKGYEGFDFELGTSSSQSAGLTIGCPAPRCNGFATNFTCRLCFSEICEFCHELRRSDHRCNKDTVASISAVFSEAKPCPKCSSLISRISGCDQMFCVECHTTFDWQTLRLIDRNTAHNPHYFQWLFAEGQVQQVVERIAPQNQEVQCEEFITFHGLNTCFGEQIVKAAHKLRGNLPSVSDVMHELPSPAHYCLAFENFRQGILDVRATSGNHANLQPIDNIDLRVQLQVDEITMKKMKKTLLERDDDYRRCMAYRNVYFMVYETAIILFDNLSAFTRQRFRLSKEYKRLPLKQFLFQLYIQFQELFKMANDCLDYNNQVYGVDERFVKFQRHPYSQRRVKKEEDEEEAEPAYHDDGDDYADWY
jgi:hypothetical protein